MFHGVIAAGFENVVEADEVGFDIYVGVGDTVPHTGLRGKVDDDLRLVFRKEVLNERLVRKVSLYECPGAVMLGIGKLADLRKSCLLYTSRCV